MKTIVNFLVRCLVSIIMQQNERNMRDTNGVAETKDKNI